MNPEVGFLDAMRCAARIRAGERVLAAVSGGADSVALLRLLQARAADLGIGVVAAHVNHAMRGEAADADQRFVEDLAARLGLGCLVRRADPPPRTEEEARRVRHRLLRDAAREAGCGRIALAHTLDDQVETLLMRLVRGAGRRGLSAMAVAGPGGLVRPLLGVRREALRAWLAALGQDFREDETNTDQRRLRNKVRARLMPLLEEMNPAVALSLARAARVLAEEDVWMDGMASDWLEAHASPLSGAGAKSQVTAGEQPGFTGVAVQAGLLAGLPPPLARRVARRLLARGGADPRGLPFAAIERLLELAGRPGREALSIDLPGGMQAGRAGLDLVVHRAGIRPAPRSAAVAARLSVPGRTDLPGPGLSVTARVVPRDAAEPARAGARRAFLDADRLGTDLMLRTRLPGDLFHPLGAPGRRKLKQFLIDRGVPRALRDRLVLVVGPEGVAWVAGVEIGHTYRVRDSTVRVAVLEVEEPGGADVESRESGV